MRIISTTIFLVAGSGVVSSNTINDDGGGSVAHFLRPHHHHHQHRELLTCCADAGDSCHPNPECNLDAGTCGAKGKNKCNESKNYLWRDLTTNYVDNPGFDDGSTSSWLGFGSANIAAISSPPPQSGSHSAFVTNRLEAWNGVSQDLTAKLTAGQSYAVSAFVQLPSAPHDVLITVKEGESTYTTAASAVVNTANQWVEITGTFTASSLSPITMYIEGPGVNVDMYVDSVSVVDLDPNTTPSPTVSPTGVPSKNPSTPSPTSVPTRAPTQSPSKNGATQSPSSSPTFSPTSAPTHYPTSPPSTSPITPQPTNPVDNNAVQNPGFETGTTVNWTAYDNGSISVVTSPDPQSGQYSALVTGRMNPWDGIAQEMSDKLVSGQSYTMSAYVQLPSAPHNVKLTFWEGGSTWVTAASVTIETANEWVSLTGSYTAAAGSPMLMYIEGPPGGVDMLVDSVSAIPSDWKGQANSSIEQIRKRDAIITVQDVDGSTIEGAVLDIQQVRRHFAFGTAASGQLNENSFYQNFFANNFEWMVPENEAKWYSNEPQQGNLQYDAFDGMVAFCHDHDIKVRGHTIFWAVEDFVLQWVKNREYSFFPEQSELLTAVESRLTSVVSRYAGDVLHWDVNNEMLHGSLYQTRLGPDIRAWMYNTVKQIDPNTLTFVNDYNIVTWIPGEVADYKMQIQDLISQGAQIDAIGVQGHFGSNVDALLVKTQLDSLAELGLPIWVTEYDSVTSDVQTRADNLEALYRVAFAHPAVEGVLMWGFWAGAHWKGADAAIVDMDWTVNAAGLRYQQLMAEWKTSHSGLLTDLLGETSFRGFHGKYDVTVTYPDSTVENHQIYLSPGSGTQSFNLQKGSTTTTSTTVGPGTTTTTNLSCTGGGTQIGGPCSGNCYVCCWGYTRVQGTKTCRTQAPAS